MAVDGVWGNGSSQRSVEAVRRVLGWWYTIGLERASQCGGSAAADLVAPAVPPLCSAVGRARLILPGHSSVQNRHGTWRGNLEGGTRGLGSRDYRTGVGHVHFFWKVLNVSGECWASAECPFLRVNSSGCGGAGFEPKATRESHLPES